MLEKRNRREFLGDLGVALAGYLGGLGMVAATHKLAEQAARPRQSHHDIPSDRRFSYNKPIESFTFDEFMRIGRELENVVSGAVGSPVDSKILTCEDSPTYGAPEITSKITIVTDGCAHSLRHRKKYSLDEMTPAVWNRSYNLELIMNLPHNNVELIMNLPNASGHFMVALSHDKCENNRLFFYGRYLGDKTQRAIKERFLNQKKYKIGDGFPRGGTSSRMV